MSVLSLTISLTTSNLFLIDFNWLDLLLFWSSLFFFIEKAPQRSQDHFHLCWAREVSNAGLLWGVADYSWAITEALFADLINNFAYHKKNYLVSKGIYYDTISNDQKLTKCKVIFLAIENTFTFVSNRKVFSNKLGGTFSNIVHPLITT